MPLTLTSAQSGALAHVRGMAARDRLGAVERVEGVLARAGVGVGVAELRERAADHGRVALNFHPDRIAADGRTVAEALLADGVYRSQFETHISNGGLTAHPGGDRDRWEERLFGGSYQQAGVHASERPRYGGLDLLRHADGPCPRFGSCHLRLRRDSLSRATFSFGDSVTEPTAVGTIDAFELVLAALLEAAEEGGHTSVLAPSGTLLGVAAPTVATMVHLLVERPEAADKLARALDDYIESQLHGSVLLAEDVEALVADPSFVATQVGEQLEQMASRYGFDLVWHHGFQLTADEVPAEFRGPEVRSLAGRLAAELGDGSGRIDAELVGRAARRVVTEPAYFAAHAPPAETLQHLKQLWHVLVAHGQPIT